MTAAFLGRCPPLALSGHRFVRCTCLLLTSDNWSTSPTKGKPRRILPGVLVRNLRLSQELPIERRLGASITSYALFQLIGDVLKFRIKRAADRIDACDDHNRNAGGDQTIFDGGSARLVFEERKKGMHLR